MGLMDILQQYTNGASAADANAARTHFDQVASAAPTEVLGQGVADAFRDESTPSFGAMVGQMFGQSDSQQRAGVLNELLRSVGPGVLAALQNKADEGYALVSLCAEPCWNGIAARWLLPAFVYFFKLLYPFALANRQGSRVAAAAGGVILIDRAALFDAGGFGAWRDAIIDDCTLAARIKHKGHRCWIGLTHGATSLRRANFGDIAHMIARTAFVQLRESPPLTVAVSVMLIVAFWIPVLALAFGPTRAAHAVGLLAALAMLACYLPTLMYYHRNPVAALLLPLAATFFLLATWYSAWRALRGTRSVWKGRNYQRGRA